MISKRIDDAINRFYDENGLEPKYIILNAAAYGELSFEVAKQDGLDDEDAYLAEITDYKFIIVAITHSKKFHEFELA
jgi:hypothetical protein